MDDNRTIPPLPPMPVLSYEADTSPTPVWLARLICGLASVTGLVAAGYVAAARIPGSASPHAWSDMPVAACGLVLAIFGALGICRVHGSRHGITISAILLLLCSWLGQWAYLQPYGAANDNSMIATALVGMVDNASVPIFLVLCLNREPIKGYFNSREKAKWI